MKKDRNVIHMPLYQEAPGGSGLYVRTTGQLTGYGRSHYQFLQANYFCPHIVVKGQGTVRAGGQEYSVGPGAMFCIFDGYDIEYFEETRHPWQYYWIHLEGEQRRGFVESLGFTGANVVWPGNAKFAQRLFAQIFEIAANARRVQQFQALAWLYELAALCLPEVELDSAADGAALAENACVFIDAMLHTPINVNEIAQTLGVSRTTLFRLFKRHKQISPIDYLVTQRLELACHLLRSSGKSIPDIARAAGFLNDKYFQRLFKKRLHTTPGRFRRGQG